MIQNLCYRNLIIFEIGKNNLVQKFLDLRKSKMINTLNTFFTLKVWFWNSSFEN